MDAVLLLIDTRFCARQRQMCLVIGARQRDKLNLNAHLRMRTETGEWKGHREVAQKKNMEFMKDRSLYVFLQLHHFYLNRVHGAKLV